METEASLEPNAHTQHQKQENKLGTIKMDVWCGRKLTRSSEEDRFASVTPVHDVVDRPGIPDSQLAPCL